MHELEAVVLGGIVRACDHDGTDNFSCHSFYKRISTFPTGFGFGEVESRGGKNAEVDSLDTALLQAQPQSLAQRGRAGAPVAGNHDLTFSAFAPAFSQRMSERKGILRVQCFLPLSSNVVSAQDARIEAVSVFVQGLLPLTLLSFKARIVSFQWGAELLFFSLATATLAATHPPILPQS